MTESLHPRSFKAFAVVEALRSGSADIRGALVPFFHPVLAFANGKVFNSQEISAAANENYHWSLTPDIVEGLIPTFSEQGWLKEIESSDQSAAYRITCYLPDGTFYSNLSDDLKNLAEAFQEFIADISPLSKTARTSDDLLNILLRWIVSLEAYSDSELRTEIVKSLNEGKKSVYNVIRTASGIEQDDQFLCARFSKHLVDVDSELVGILSEIARIGLITETVQDFAKPVTSIRRTNLVVYLDAPVAMDYLDVSGTAARQSVRPIVERLKQIGASIRVFDTSIEEIQRNLSAVLRRPEPLRTGITATAMRRGQVLESYVRQVASRPDQALASQGIQTVSRTLDQYPNDHPFFTDADYRELYSSINWHNEDVPRAHDALVVTNIMRMRRGNQSSDIFESGQILVTRNGILPGAARRLAIAASRLGGRSVGPVVHLRELATAVWLRAGLDSEEHDRLPLRYLMASCERVLQVRPDVIEKVRQQAKARSPETAHQLDLLLSVDRSTEMLMDKTLNVSNVVTDENIEILISEMKESLISEKVAEYKSEVRAIKGDTKKTIEQIRRDAEEVISREAAARKRASDEAANLQTYMADRDLEDRQALESLLADVNAALVLRVRMMRRIVAGAIFALEICSALVAYQYPGAITGILLLSITIILVSHFGGIIEKILPYGSISFEKANANLYSEAERRGLGGKLTRVKIAFVGDSLLIE